MTPVPAKLSEISTCRIQNEAEDYLEKHQYRIIEGRSM